MKQSVAHTDPPTQASPWPLATQGYDRSRDLSLEEYEELVRLFAQAREQIRTPTKYLLQRLVCPVEDVFCLVHAPQDACYAIIRTIFREMHQRRTSFWAWSLDEWLEIIGPDLATFTERQRWNCRRHPARIYLPLIVYLLRTVPDPWRLFEHRQQYLFAQKCFGKGVIDESIKRLRDVLQSWGYQEKQQESFAACVSYLLLRNESPRLEDRTRELLEQIAQTCTVASVHHYLSQVTRALFELGMIERPLPDARADKTSVSGTDGSVAQEWLIWCQRWLKQTTAQAPGNIYYSLLKVGRWLKAHHPEVTSPANWTYEISTEFVAAVNQMKVGEWSSTPHNVHLPSERIGQPLRPRAKNRMLQCMRIFLRDCQEWQWIAVRLNPDRALRTPHAITKLTGPDPRTVEKQAWAKVLWAAMNLEAEDLPQPRGLLYPIEMVRAVAMVWCFAALRSDEIVRLRVGCVRWQYEDVMIPESGEILPKDATCFLDIPVNKTETAYTKPVHPLVGKRVNEWEQIRPKEQPKVLDQKTSEPVQYLFSYRGKRLSKNYINGSLIPCLWKTSGYSR